jgi:hypothetical protein
VQAGNVSALWPTAPSGPPPLPAAGVAGRVIVNGQYWGSALWFRISFDGLVLGESRLLKGCDFPFETSPGEHAVEVVYGGPLTTLGQKTKTYPLTFRESGSYRITLKLTMGMLGMRFADNLEVQRVPGSR